MASKRSDRCTSIILLILSQYRRMGNGNAKSSLLMIYIFLTILFGMYIIYRSVPQTKIFSCLIMASGDSPKSNTTDVSSTIAASATVPPVVVRKADESCLYSLAESDGWFCEYDNDWKRRKRVHRFQNKRNRNDESISKFFEKNWEPTLHCAFEQRFGNPGVGGRWVCDTNNIEVNNYVPLIYSLGSNGDFSFEQALKQALPPAEIHTFDSESYTCPKEVCTYHPIGVGDASITGRKSLITVMEELGHKQRQMDILKIDLEGNEYVLLEEYFRPPQDANVDSNNKPSDSKAPYIRQILMEIHLLDGNGDEPAARAHGLFELLRSNNYAIFHKEIHSTGSNATAEYGFIRLNRVFFNSSRVPVEKS